MFHKASFFSKSSVVAFRPCSTKLLRFFQFFRCCFLDHVARSSFFFFQFSERSLIFFSSLHNLAESSSNFPDFWMWTRPKYLGNSVRVRKLGYIPLTGCDNWGPFLRERFFPRTSGCKKVKIDLNHHDGSHSKFFGQCTRSKFLGYLQCPKIWTVGEIANLTFPKNRRFYQKKPREAHGPWTRLYFLFYWKLKKFLTKIIASSGTGLPISIANVSTDNTLHITTAAHVSVSRSCAWIVRNVFYLSSRRVF